MTVETATYIGQLSVTQPPGSDPVSEGDNHIRLLKQVLINTFPGTTDRFIDTAHTWSGIQTIVVPNGGTVISLQSTLDTAAAGPVLQLYRNSPSPAISDVLGTITFVGKDDDSPANVVTYGQIYGVLTSPVNTNKQSSLYFSAMQDNALTASMQLFGATLRITSTDDLAAVEPVLELFRDSASPADGDTIGGVHFMGRATPGAVFTRYAQIQGFITDSDAASENAELRFGVANGASAVTQFIMSPTALYPISAGLMTLGDPTRPWQTLYLDGDGNVNWENGAATLYHNSTTDTLTMSGTNLAVFGSTTITGNTTISGNTTIAGNATINGTTLQVNANAAVVGNLTMTSGVASLTSAAADVTTLSVTSNSQNAGTAQNISIVIGGSAGAGERYIRFGDVINGLQGTIQSAGVGGGINITGDSDGRLKDNVRDLDDSGTIVDALRPRRFKWRVDSHEDFGFIAQEVHEVIPAIVTVGGDDPKEHPWLLARGSMEAILVAEIKSLRNRVAALEKQ